MRNAKLTGRARVVPLKVQPAVHDGQRQAFQARHGLHQQILGTSERRDDATKTKGAAKTTNDTHRWHDFRFWMSHFNQVPFL